MSNSNLTEETREYYQNLIGDVGEKYFNDRWMSNPVAKAHYRQTVKAIRHALKDLPDNLSTLEIGSGPGTWTDLCLEKANSMKVFDISDEFLKVMRHKYRDKNKMKDFIHGDFAEDAANLQDDSFDLIFSGRALEYMTDKSRVISNCFEHLNDGGQLVIITKNPMWRDKLSSSETTGIHRAQIYWKDLESIFREQGFVNIKVYPAAMGSYLPPFNNKVGIWLSNLVFQLTYGKPMTKRVSIHYPRVISSAHENQNNLLLSLFHSHASFPFMISGLLTMPERYNCLFDIEPGQHIYLGKSLPDVWKHQLKKNFRVSIGNKIQHCDLLVEANISKSLRLIEKGSLCEIISNNGSALLQVSKKQLRSFRWIKKRITKQINQINKSGISVTLPDDAGAMNYFALSIKPGFENPNEISLIPCTINSGGLYIARESVNSAGSIAVLATKRGVPFSSQLFRPADDAISTGRTTITRIMFRERGTLIVEAKDTDNNQYISRSSIIVGGDMNIAKNYKIIESLHANPAITQDSKRLIPKPVARFANASIEVKKPGQLAWKIVRGSPELETIIMAQAWDFSFSLCVGTNKQVKVDSDKFDAIIGSDLEYIQQFCRSDSDVTRLLVSINKYLLKHLLDKEMFVVFSHGDYGYGNILCDSKTGSLSGVIDWDTSRDTELPGIDFINLLIQKFRAHSSMGESYKAAFLWITSEQSLPVKIRDQLYEEFGIIDKNLELYSLVAVLHLMSRDFSFREAGSLTSEERAALLLAASTIH